MYGIFNVKLSPGAYYYMLLLCMEWLHLIHDQHDMRCFCGARDVMCNIDTAILS